ncbi:MAG: hypothetical protein GWM92_09170, partial [Gemmatimonadetes bacterium]|nr:hypothetical protein [Gemmatimonadota bacterium]NIR78825.1 hypothetical protein [Gemmatimonadota bacterium]NIT87453.1 hypothetical protein [Gemmatimonadota bacterium]NIU31317.1 hypothetical protein [Gemmatimonadota bacterium]NIU36016.1 hypothetical protein [Gemmatimonadota bacterium]
MPPEHVDELVARIDGDYAAELGLGVVHARPSAGSLPSLRAQAESLGGRALVLDRNAEIGAFGSPGAASGLDVRLKRAL